jgi:hypothetical protein
MNTTNKRIGQYVKSSIVGDETYGAYVPPNLPPDPALDMTGIYPLLDQANTALGRLDGMSMVLPEPCRFVPYRWSQMRKSSLPSPPLIHRGNIGTGTRKRFQKFNHMRREKHRSLAELGYFKVA